MCFLRILPNISSIFTQMHLLWWNVCSNVSSRLIFIRKSHHKCHIYIHSHQFKELNVTLLSQESHVTFISKVVSNQRHLFCVVLKGDERYKEFFATICTLIIQNQSSLSYFFMLYHRMWFLKVLKSKYAFSHCSHVSFSTLLT